MSDHQPDHLVAPADADAAAAPQPADVRRGGDAAHGAQQQDSEEFPSPIGGAPWQDPDQPAPEQYSGDR